MQFSNTRRLGQLLGLALVAGALAGCRPIQAPAAGSPASATPAAATAGGEVPVVSVTVSADGLSMPGEVPSGVVTFQIVNDGGPEGTWPEFGRLNDGVTMDQFQEAMMSEDQTAAVALVSIQGSPSTSVDGRVVYDLQEGNYVAVLFLPEGPPSIATFTAGAPSGAQAPAAGVTAQLADFAFILPDEIAAGPQTWQIENVGQQWHEMAIVQLSEGVTVEDVLAMLAEAGPEGPSGPPPYADVAFWSPMSAGEKAWVTWDLPAGEYTVVCFLPDLNGDMAPHAAQGMVRALVVK